MPQIEVRDYKFDFAAPATQKKDITGNFLFVFEAVGVFTVKIDNKNPIECKQGSKLSVSPFQSVEIISTIAQTIRIKSGLGDYDELSATISIDPDTEELPVTFDQENEFTTEEDHTVGNSAAEVIPADVSSNPRRFVHITALDSNTEVIRLGDLANVSLTRGKILSAGETWTTGSIAQIAGICASGGQKLAIAYEAKV